MKQKRFFGTRGRHNERSTVARVCGFDSTTLEQKRVDNVYIIIFIVIIIIIILVVFATTRGGLETRLGRLCAERMPSRRSRMGRASRIVARHGATFWFCRERHSTVFGTTQESSQDARSLELVYPATINSQNSRRSLWPTCWC
jgi:hypothetical protein